MVLRVCDYYFANEFYYLRVGVEDPPHTPSPGIVESLNNRGRARRERGSL